MNLLCPYKDIFGQPKRGVHKYRLFGLAFVDLLLTFIGAILLAYYRPLIKELIIGGDVVPQLMISNTIIYFFVLWFIGWCLHILFCVDTPLTPYK